MFQRLVQANTSQLAIRLLLTVFFLWLPNVFYQRSQDVVNYRIPRGEDVQLNRSRLGNVVVRFTSTFRIVNGLRTIRMKRITTISIVPQIITIGGSLRNGRRVINVRFADKDGPINFLGQGVTARIRTVNHTIIRCFPTFNGFQRRTVNVKVSVRRSVVGLNNGNVSGWPATHFK